MNRVIGGVLFVILFLCGCSGGGVDSEPKKEGWLGSEPKKGDEYIGKWVETLTEENIRKNTRATFSITRNGENFLVERKIGRGREGIDLGRDGTVSAVLRDGLLDLGGGDTITHIKETGRLLTPDGKFRKIVPSNASLSDVTGSYILEKTNMQLAPTCKVATKGSELTIAPDLMAHFTFGVTCAGSDREAIKGSWAVEFTDFGELEFGYGPSSREPPYSVTIKNGRLIVSPPQTDEKVEYFLGDDGTPLEIVWKKVK